MNRSRKKPKKLLKQKNIVWDRKVAETRGDVLALIANKRARRNEL